MMGLPVETFSMYRRGMDVVRAQEDLMKLRISCAPKMEKHARENLFTRLESASRLNPPEAQPMTPELLERLLHG
jgi:hypothetical protein